MNGINWVPSVRHYCLRGPAGAEMDLTVGVLVGVGLSVTCLAAGTRYRVSGASEEQLAMVAAQVNGTDGFDMAYEKPDAGVIRLTSKVEPVRPPRRTVHIEGEGLAYSMVARAVDAGLTVACAGFGRWSVTGLTLTLMQWAAEHVHEASLNDTMAVYGLDAATAAAEDAEAAAPTVNVVLPERRRTTTAIERDSMGQIASVTQIEESVTE